MALQAVTQRVEITKNWFCPNKLFFQSGVQSFTIFLGFQIRNYIVHYLLHYFSISIPALYVIILAKLLQVVGTTYLPNFLHT